MMMMFLSSFFNRRSNGRQKNCMDRLVSAGLDRSCKGLFFALVLYVERRNLVSALRR
jgi:hypothetical protein